MPAQVKGMVRDNPNEWMDVHVLLAMRLDNAAPDIVHNPDTASATVTEFWPA